MADVETALVLRMEASLAKFEKQMKRAKKAGTDTADGLEKRFANSNKKMSRSAETSAQAIGKEMDRLRAKYDPLFAASKKYEASLEELNRAQKVGALTGKQYEAALERLNAEYAHTTASSKNAATSTNLLNSNLGEGSRRLGAYQSRVRGFGGGIQNVSYQIGDFATQVGAGTSASMALGQQLPQLLGGFGALGAVMGAAVAIGVPLAANFIDLGDSAKSTREKIEKLETSLDRLKEAMKETSAAGREDLKEAFGDVTASILALVESEKQLALLQTAKDLREASDALASFTDSGMWGTLAGYAASAGGEIRKLRDELEISWEDAERLYQAFRDIEAAEGPRQQANAFGRVRALLLDAVGSYQDLTDEQIAFIENLNKAERAAERHADLVADAEKATQGLVAAALAAADGFAGAIGPVDSLIGKVSALAKNAWSYANAMAKEHAKKNGPIGMPASVMWAGGDVTRAGVGTVLDMGDGTTVTIGDKPKQTVSSSGSSGGGGGSSRSPMPGLFATSDDQLQNIQRQIEMIGKTRSEVARMTAEYKLLDEARKRGLDLDAQQTASGETLRQEIARQADTIGKLTEAKERASEKTQAMTQLQDQLKDGFIDAIVEGENLSGVMENLAKSIAKAALQAALFGEGPWAGDGGGLLGSIFGSVFGGPKIPENASGTDYWRGGLTSVHERGGEIMNLPRGTQIIPHDISKRMADRSGGGRQKVDIVLHAPEGFTAEQIGQVRDVSLKVADARIGANSRAQADNRYLSGGR